MVDFRSSNSLVLRSECFGFLGTALRARGDNPYQLRQERVRRWNQPRQDGLYCHLGVYLFGFRLPQLLVRATLPAFGGGGNQLWSIRRRPRVGYGYGSLRY